MIEGRLDAKEQLPSVSHKNLQPETTSMAAEGGLESDAKQINEQTNPERTPELGENLLTKTSPSDSQPHKETDK
jgi:hypothetical protein